MARKTRARIGAYAIRGMLGQGGMGTVYLAEHALLGRKAAVKVLLPELSLDERIVKRFFNEARATTSIADPGIVQIFDFGIDTDGSAYIVMELLEGESIHARLKRLRRFSPADTVRLVRQIAGSLATAHARGIIHRDLKPENLFVVGDAAVTGGERTKILDFGIAKLARDADRTKTRTGSIVGTPQFMSPEQCRGLATVDHRADIYALGCVMYVMLTGRPVFEGEGLGDIMFKHVGSAPPVPSHVVPEIGNALDQIILRCLAKAPADRFQSMQELIAAFDSAAIAVYDAPTTAGEFVRYTPAYTTQSHAAGQAAGHATAASVATPPKRTRLYAIVVTLSLAIGGGTAFTVNRGLAQKAEARAHDEPTPVTAPAPVSAAIDTHAPVATAPVATTPTPVAGEAHVAAPAPMVTAPVAAAPVASAPVATASALVSSRSPSPSPSPSATATPVAAEHAASAKTIRHSTPKPTTKGPHTDAPTPRSEPAPEPPVQLDRAD
ncbi:MAG: protein kinase [Kofleriaceae bacterium]